MIKFNFFRFLACSFFMAGNLLCFVNLTWANPPQIRPTQHQKLRPMPEGSYQLARSVFLPDANDDIWLSDYNKIPNPRPIDQNPCVKQGYNLTSCPSYGICSLCPSDGAYKKLNSCEEGYKLSEDKTYCKAACQAKTCDSSYTAGYCPTGTVCESCTEVASDCTERTWYKVTSNCKPGYHYSGGACVIDCSVKSCPSNAFEDRCPTGGLCTKLSSGYQNADCSTGSCYQFNGCDTANGYFAGSSFGSCVMSDCYKTQTNCSGFPLTSCPANGTCSSCTITNADCSTDGKRYKLESCDAGYNKVGNTCQKSCLVTTCDKSSPNGYFMTTCPEGRICGSCNEISSNCSQITYYSLNPPTGPSCQYGYHYNSSFDRCLRDVGACELFTNCEKTNCKEFLETQGGSANYQKIFVSNQQELQQALKDVSVVSSGKYEYQIVVADSFVIEGNLTNIYSFTKIKGVREILPTGIYEDVCVTPKIIAVLSDISEDILEGITLEKRYY